MRAYSLTLLALGLILPGLALADDPTAATATVDCTQRGVLTRCVHTDFTSYLNALINDNITLVMLVALAMIVYSGVQYMSSGFSASAQKDAKARIMGILTGVVFYLLIRLILSLLTNSNAVGTI